MKASIVTALTATLLIITTHSFQTPIIFPLLWLSKQQLASKNNHDVFSPAPSHHHHHRRRRRLSPPPPKPSLQRTNNRSSSLTLNFDRNWPFFSIFAALFNIVATKLDRSKLADQKLLSWLSSESSSSSSTGSVIIDTHPTTHIRGLFAARDIRVNELIVEVPYHVALLVGDTLSMSSDWENTYNLSNLQDKNEGDVEDVLQGLYFLENFVSGGSFNQLNNDDSGGNSVEEEYDYEKDSDYYAPYVTSLPPKPSNIVDEGGLTPDFWSDSTIMDIGIPTYTQKILDRKQIIRTIAQNNHVEESDLQWATFLIRSRRFTTWNMVPDPNYAVEEDDDDEDGGGRGGQFWKKTKSILNQKKVEQIQGFLVPLIDMANHSPNNSNAVMEISVNKWTRKFDETSTFALRATRSIRKGEEITISYGDGTSTCLELLDKYGFFVEGEDENGADERGIDLEELGPVWKTSVEDDEVELDRLKRSVGGKDSSTSSSSSSKLKTIVSRLQDEYTCNFPSMLDNNDEMKLIGSGIREKLGINIYAVGMYGSPLLLDAVTPSDLRYKARQFGSSSSDNGSGMTSFVLEMILQAEAKVIAEAIADSVGVRYDGSRLDIEQLENLISDGISGNGGQAKKGTTLRFDCTKEGVTLAVDGVERGVVKASGLGKAFVDVYLDNNAVSPSLIDSCIDNSSIAANAVVESTTEIDGDGSASRRTMLSLRIWLKRLKKWTKPEDEPVAAVSDEVVADSAEVSAEASPPVDDSLDTTNEDADATEEVDETAAVAEISTDEVANESKSDDKSSNDVTMVESSTSEPTVDESTQAAEGVIEDEPAAAVQPEPEVATASVSPKNIADIESILGSGLTDKATSVSFKPKLDDGLYLAGVGVRKKAIINVYAVAMYTSPSTLASVATLSKGKEAQAALRDSARSFNPTTPMTSFVLEMTFKADGKTIGEAIGEGVKPRYSGPGEDVKQLESLIIEGVKSKGGQATKGTIFRFDCTKDGINVSVDGVSQGQVSCDGIGSALVDVFTDNIAVSQQLVDSCLGTWCGSGLVIEPVDVQPTPPPATNQDLEPKSVEPATTGLPEKAIRSATPMQTSSVLDKSKFDPKDIAARISELEAEIAAEITRVKSQQGVPASDVASSQQSPAGEGAQSADAGPNPPVVDEKAAAVESKAKPLKEKATGVSFDPKLEDGLFLVGAGVRKKAIINVYAVAMYSSPTAIASLGPLKKGKDAQSTLRDSSRTFNPLTPMTSFVLEMTFKADGKTIAEAIADGVKPRHSGSADAVTELENLIVEGVKSKGGQATKGTIFRFDCDAEGVAVSVDGNMQGKVVSEGMGSALVDVFMDDKAVSPQLVESCMTTWCGSGL